MGEDMRDLNKLLLRLLRRSPTARTEEPRKIESWLDEVRCSGCYEYIEKHDVVYHGSYCRLCVEEADMMEKRGVVASENEVPATKEAAEQKQPSTQPSAQVQKVSGDDLVSKMADKVAAASKK